jgi:hypothetical protein
VEGKGDCANQDAPNWKPQNIEVKQNKLADQPAKKRDTPYRIHVWPFLNLRS